ncbi:MAG: hypothetical protein SFX74_12490 [Fimbriimonadaceae bacterium]|nr:hypothetical protein [Fimbriimonadaceae bacterium]
MMLAAWLDLVAPDDSGAAKLPVVRRYAAPEARQAVAVDREFFYAITNRTIAKYRKRDGQRVATWTDETGKIAHMNSGIVLDRKVYCCNSNYPNTPMQSSIEVFDTASLRHERSLAFGIDAGSLTWLERFDGTYWAVFGHYNGKGGEPGKLNDRTVLVKLDREYRRVGGYAFPKSVIDRWDGMTCSGGVWHPNGFFITTGHHAPEIYVLRLPEAGPELEHMLTLGVESEGQGIALDPSDPRLLWTIQRKTGEVLVSRLPDLR